MCSANRNLAWRQKADLDIPAIMINLLELTHLNFGSSDSQTFLNYVTLLTNIPRPNALMN